MKKNKIKNNYIQAGDSIYLHLDIYVLVSSEINISKYHYNKIKILIGEAAKTTFKNYIEKLKKERKEKE